MLSLRRHTLDVHFTEPLTESRRQVELLLLAAAYAAAYAAAFSAYESHAGAGTAASAAATPTPAHTHGGGGCSGVTRSVPVPARARMCEDSFAASKDGEIQNLPLLTCRRALDA
jgi:hypothetical protein